MHSLSQPSKGTQQQCVYLKKDMREMTLGFSFLLLSFTFRWLLFFFPSRALILYIHLVFSSGGLIFQILFSFHMVWVHLKFLLVRIFLTDRYICGHATLAAAHTVFSNGLIGSSDTVEFSTHSGILTDDCEAKLRIFLHRTEIPCDYNLRVQLKWFLHVL